MVNVACHMPVRIKVLGETPRGGVNRVFIDFC